MKQHQIHLINVIQHQLHHENKMRTNRPKITHRITIMKYTTRTNQQKKSYEKDQPNEQVSIAEEVLRATKMRNFSMNYRYVVRTLRTISQSY